MGLTSSALFESSNHHVVLLGLDHAGKTTVLYRLKRQKMVLPTPTVGFNCEKFRINHGPARGHSFVLWDVGGQESFRTLWPTYLKNAVALVFVIDASDQRRFEEAKVELDTVLLSLSPFQRFPVILLINKQDKPDAVSADQVMSMFTHDLKSSCTVRALQCCAVTGEGLERFFPELLNAIAISSKRTDNLAQFESVFYQPAQQSRLHGGYGNSQVKVSSTPMPTTCGFPNCKFRSRYRGQEDNRHFYRIPKRPLVLRQRWLKAIGRTEETVVSQLRICSAHFEGGEKKEGDIPVPDPQLDSPLSIPLPPKESKNNERRRIQKSYRNQATGSSSSSTDTSFSSTCDRRRSHFPTFGLQNDLSCIYASSSAAANNLSFGSEFLSNITPAPDEKESRIEEVAARFSRSSPNGLKFLSGYPVIFPAVNRLSGGMKPLVALLDGRDCSVEMPMLKDIATVAFCDAQATSEIHEKVLNEAVAALMWNTIRLEQADLEKFKALKLIICLGSDTSCVNVKAASELGIAVCNTPGICVDEVADSTLSMILSLYRRTHWLSRTMESGKTATGIEQIREFANGARRIRDSTLGIIGLGQVGSAVVLRAKAFGFNVLFYDPFAHDGAAKVFGIERCDSLENLLKRSDCVSLHCALTPETHNLLNEDNLRRLKFGAFVVNTGRPELINEVALATYLRSGQVKAAALDIQHIVDVNCAAQLAANGQIIHTASTAWLSEESAHELRVAAAKELRRALTGRIPHDLNHCINKSQLATRPSISTNSTAATAALQNVTNPAFNALSSLGFGNAVSEAYNGMPIPTSFGQLPYTNPLFMGMNPQLLMGNPSALANFGLSGAGAAGLQQFAAASRLLSQSPKCPVSTKRSVSGTSTPANNRAASATRSDSNSPSSMQLPNGNSDSHAHEASSEVENHSNHVEHGANEEDVDGAAPESKKIKLEDGDADQHTTGVFNDGEENNV